MLKVVGVSCHTNAGSTQSALSSTALLVAVASLSRSLNQKGMVFLTISLSNKERKLLKLNPQHQRSIRLTSPVKSQLLHHFRVTIFPLSTSVGLPKLGSPFVRDWKTSHSRTCEMWPSAASPQRYSVLHCDSSSAGSSEGPGSSSVTQMPSQRVLCILHTRRISRVAVLA